MMGGDLVLAGALDAAIGDPRWLPHPVRLMGRTIAWFERRARPMCQTSSALRWAGIVLAVGLPVVAYVAGWFLIVVATNVHEWVGRGVAIFLACSTLAWRDLVDHVSAVSNALKTGALPQARQAVARVVGRDTENLSEADVVRATVETIAESASDGVIAPLFYLAIGGAPLALAYKAINTLDSLVGHRDDRYRDFGWASARSDDVVNWVPARITAWLLAIAAGLTLHGRKSFRQSRQILMRDGHKHPSPNSGRPEAAMAGALGVQLGGVNFYDGIVSERPCLGNALEPLALGHIEQALTLVKTAYLIAFVGALALLWLRP
ncbi:MAG: adenosylcobinamide-phosphate synthase CbiB [Nitrospiraceae bacterium]